MTDEQTIASLRAELDRERARIPGKYAFLHRHYGMMYVRQRDQALHDWAASEAGQKLDREGALSYQDYVAQVEGERDEARETCAALEKEAAAYAERDLIIQAVLATSGRVEGDGPDGKVADVTIPALACVLAVLLIKPDGALYNYVEWAMGELPGTGPLSIALQRGNGKTPGMIVGEAQADAAALREALGLAIEQIGTDMHYVPAAVERKIKTAFDAPHPGAPFLALLVAARAYMDCLDAFDADPLHTDPDGSARLAAEQGLRDALVAHDPKEVYQVRVQIDQSIYVRGTIEEIARAAFQAGYERGREEAAAENAFLRGWLRGELTLVDAEIDAALALAAPDAKENS